MSKKNYFNYKKYDIRPTDYQLMLKHQDGKCAICKKSSVNKERLCVDHDHESGEIRGLLCNNCNLMIGLGKDTPEILTAGAKYLEEGGDSSRFYVEGGRLLSSFK